MQSDYDLLLQQIEAKGIRSKKVLHAMAKVDRKKFVPTRHKAAAYIDAPLPIGSGQTISQPYIVALMTEKLNVGPDDRVLEVGTGSGYQCAILTRLTPHVYSIEKTVELIETAKRNLAAAGCRIPFIKQGDGYEGWEEHAPFDRIIVTAAAAHVPQPLTAQLAPGGRMVIPVGGVNEMQYLMLLEKDDREEVSSSILEPVRFVPLVGRAQERREKPL